MKSTRLPFFFSVSVIAAVLTLGVSTFAASPVNPAPPVTAPASNSPVPQDEIHDIRPPIHLPTPFPWAWWGVSVAAAGALGCGAWKLLRRSRVKTPCQIALENLETMRALMRPETTRLFSQAVSEVVRRFIEECLPVRAAHRTTAEFLHDLASHPDTPLTSHQEALTEFLGHCDLAKFARWCLSREQMEAMLQSARAFVLAVGTSTQLPKNKAAPVSKSSAELLSPQRQPTFQS